jgi:pimeloyl-ACP methyl ester carboxylesterase
MDSTFYGLLDNTIAEVCRREPAYTSSFPMTVCYEEMSSAYIRQPLCSNLPAGAVEQALQEGIGYFARKWKMVKQADATTDPVTQLLCDSVVDAYCADQGLLALEPHHGTSGPVAEVLEQEYSKRQSRRGLTYYIRNQGSRPLLLINATGAPIAVWYRFLADPAHDFKIILPQRRGSDLFRGGLQQHVDISTDSSDLGSILDNERFQQIDVLAWCNGARVGIDFANSRAPQISSMVLLGPMLKGIHGVPASPSNFERDLQPLLDAVKKESSLAPFMAQVIAKQPTSPDWNRWINSPVARAQALFAMPARDHASAMIAMLTDPQSFINIACRVDSDESYPMNQALERLQTRTMVIMGSDDGIVSNELVSSAMKQMCRNIVTRVILRGSGHYIHDLQYHYFRWLLNAFLADRQLPPGTARIDVDGLGTSRREAAAVI